MKKLILLIVFILLSITTPVSVFAQYPANCWDIMQDNTCLKNFTECNINCPSTGDQRQRACQDACNKTSKSCSDEQVANYKACVNANRKAPDTQETKQLQPSVEPAIEPTAGQQGKGFTIGLDEVLPSSPTDTKDDNAGLLDKLRFIFVEPDLVSSASDFITVTFTNSEIKGAKLPDRQPTITTEDEEKIWDIPSETGDSSNFNIWQISGNTMKVVKTKPSFSLTSPSAMTLIPSNGEPMRFRYEWKKDSGAVFDVFPKSDVKLPKPTQDKQTQEIKRIIKLDKGELELKVKNVNAKNKFGVQTDFVELIVIGTHFWVKNDPDKRQTSIAVYEGKVEVKTKDGQATTVTPNGDQPRVVVVSQKFSPTKLIVASLVLVVVIGVVVFILKRKFTAKGFSKKKK